MLKIVIGSSSLAKYPEGGGHWSWLLQHFLGLLDLGHDVTLLELMSRLPDDEANQHYVMRFFERMAEFGVDSRCVLVAHDSSDESPLDQGEVTGRDRASLMQTVDEADLLWNLALAIHEPELSRFRYRVLIDVDPGQLQAGAAQWPTDLDRHDAFVTVGSKVNDRDCSIPKLDHAWIPILPPVHLPMWPDHPDPSPDAPLTSVTHWNWGGEDVVVDGRLISTSKRLSYLRYAGVPAATGLRFQLAADIHPDDTTGDREILANHGWEVVDPRTRLASPLAYREFIARSRAEFGCCKAVFRELLTGWFSDRSACYLATGRPVICEDTGVSDHIPTGEGILTFGSFEEALERVHEIDNGYSRHRAAARETALGYLDASKVLSKALVSLP